MCFIVFVVITCILLLFSIIIIVILIIIVIIIVIIVFFVCVCSVFCWGGGVITRFVNHGAFQQPTYRNHWISPSRVDQLTVGFR